MSESDLLNRMLQAWRDDIESVPFPQFRELAIPQQTTRAEIDRTRRRVAPVPHAPRHTDRGW
ncbi:hypothetical protein [Amycolatopsis benzoatilytica]|uniref:hypothetical protein n=1 Tax=Amycolatopsis benzoatilytica TaxID=346045 RepID=UPI000368F6E4|nr:hypothetical protein [Amycolatopsis benzoatilytica]